MKKNLPGLLLVFILANSSSAQDTLQLRLQDALDAATKNNTEIIMATLDEESATARFRQTNAVFLPQVNLSYTAMTSNNPLNAFGFKLQQQSVSMADFNPQLLNHPVATQNYAAKAGWIQPVLNADMIYQRKAAKEQIEAYHYKTARTKEYLRFEVHKAYAQLQLAYEATVVWQEALHTVNAIYQTSRHYYDKGLLQKADLLLVQVQVTTTESKLAEAKSNVQNASNYLSLLMNVKSGPVYRVDTLEKMVEGKAPEGMVPEGRYDLLALKSALKAQQAMISAEQMTYLPKLNGFADYMLNDKTAGGFGSKSYLAGVQLSWNVFNGTASYYRTAEQKVTRLKMEQQLSYQKDQSQLELNKTLRDLEYTRFDLQQHQTSVVQSAEALRIRQDRFEQGLLSANDLLQSQSAFSEQKLLLSEAIFRYNTTLAYIEFLTSNNK